ncbi:universal stress protein [Aurantimonas marianensis]|uniref:Universal stress protein n=1 Tax=Aurantimonas marianensis TaxID=2920428 RepID=A0A9X2H5I6_9HYPH|nr:universal stress protein [Aurantimonas marianensis]MCP3054170.1 universal stress protein [Aurantimonas marianensis]
MSTQAIRDIAVQVDGSHGDAAKMSHADMIAAMFDAHIVALLTNYLQTGPIPMGPGRAWLRSELHKRGVQLGDAAETHARERLATSRMSTELRRIDYDDQELGSRVGPLARAVDLVVVGRPHGDGGQWPEMFEAVIFDAGAPAYVVPPDAVNARKPDTILIAWKDAVECSHAIKAALPFLQRAKQVYLVSVAETSSDEERHREPAADMARHLARHGIAVEIRHLPRWEDAAAGLLNEASSLGAELIVVGAYGRTRLRQMLFGGVTRELLTRSPIPLLMAH